MRPRTIDIQQCRNMLPELASLAHTGEPSLLTRHGKPYAAIVAPEMLVVLRPQVRFLALRGSGKGLWGASPAGAACASREEWR